ncbi:MAG TPA: transcription antitermination factor NusB [Propionicimonas sp.]|nr:transcription antitermination factor NusB [Propionicimonas sp.]HQA77064.1 transcription antitermination factor NusB [Propionicimonas sp.]HQD96194.1 transcription antitermination factor NusB [Propionicimonas sp.]
MTSPEPGKKLSTRTKARKRALDILFEADLRGLPATEVLAAHTAEADPPVRPFTADLVRGTFTNLRLLDTLIASHLPSGWTLERMPRVDRNLARLTAYELGHTEIDTAIALAECMTLAGELSTDDSPGFLNGVLAAVARDVRPA